MRKRILLIRLSAIGDVINALPVARAVRRGYPEAEISWLVEDTSAELVGANPNIDRVFSLPRGRWSRELRRADPGVFKDMRSFFGGLRKSGFDMSLDLHGIFRSALSSYLSGAADRFGPADGREGSGFFYTEKIRTPAGKGHVVTRNISIAGSIGASTGEAGFDIVVPPAIREKAEEMLERIPPGDRRIVAVNPFTSWSSKNWPVQRYARMADRIINELDCAVLFTGSRADRRGVGKIIRLMKGTAFNLAGETGLLELAGLLKGADLFIGGDTGPMHLAAAMGTRVIALMGPTSALTNGPYGEGHTVLKAGGYKNCWKQNCPSGNLCMREITVDDVLSAAAKNLGQLPLAAKKGLRL